jgi:predicted nucleic acid-binding protein
MTRKQYSQAVLELGSSNVEISSHIKKRAEYFTLFGIKAMDALHLASAESANCDFFCTCDDRFLKRAGEIMDLKSVVVSPMTLEKELKL